MAISYKQYAGLKSLFGSLLWSGDEDFQKFKLRLECHTYCLPLFVEYNDCEDSLRHALNLSWD